MYWYIIIERDQLQSILLSRMSLMGYRYKCPLDLRSPQWLASNSLCFGTGLTEFLIQGRKASGHSQVLAKSECDRDGIDHSKSWRRMSRCISILQNLGQGNPSDGFDILKYNVDNLIRVDSWTMGCPMIILVKGMNYMKTISVWVLRMLFYTFDLSGRRVINT